MESEKVIEVATLGRPFRLGMLYDCRQDAIIPGLTLWDCDDLEKYKSETPQRNSNFEIVASESIQDKSSALDVEASLKASFLGGLVKVEGSAEYLNDQMTSKNQARVTLQYKATTKFQELSMNHLGRGNMKHPDVFEKKIATHVVTGILYGAQAFFVFDQEKSETENHQDIRGNLKVLIEKIPKLSIDGEGSLHLEDKDKEKIQKFSCKFYGDFLLEKTPTTFQDAVAVYQSLPKLLGASGENAVPIKVRMLPLTNLDSSAAKLVREISVRLVQEVQSVLEELSDLEIRSNDAMKNNTTQQFPQINKKLKSFKSLCSEFRLEFQQTLSKKLPSIRGGGEEESELADVLKKIHSSPFNSKNLNDWIDCKEREIYALNSYIRMMKNTKIKTSLTILDEELLNAEHAVCFVFSSLERDEPYLSALLNYLEDKTKSDDSHSYDIEKEQWYLSNNLKDEMRTKVKLFSDFAEANTETKNTTFLAVGLTDEKHEGSTIYLYKDGVLINENFEPPSMPETVTAAEINHSSVTLKVSPPRFGAESVTSYSVEFCVSGQDGWKQQNEPKSSEITVTQLQPNTEYVFRCRAVTSAGVGPANVINDPIKTLPCSPAGEPQCEPNSSEISVSWEKPAELGPDVQILSYIVEYAKVEDLSWNQTRSKGEKAIISELQSETQYSVRITCDCGEAGRSKESKTVQVHTTKPNWFFGAVTSKIINLFKQKPKRLSDAVKAQSTKLKPQKGPLPVYRVPLKEENNKIKGCRFFRFGELSKVAPKQSRTIMVLGATGAGKSTLINGMINYILGVKWSDSYRFNLVDDGQTKSQAHSQTSEVTVYKLNHREEFEVPFSLTIIDTPGFGDTRGIDRDREITEQLRNLFTSKDGVSEIDAVCFVAQAALARLTPTQKYVFDSILSIFGKDIAENIRILVTFADGQKPPVLEAIKAADVPSPKGKDGLPVHFKFNNSALFADNKSSAADTQSGDDDDDGNFDQMFWNMGTKSMKRFFAALNQIETKSLTLTNEVLRERKQLEVSVENLQVQVKLGLAKMEEIRETGEKIKEHEAEISRNDNFEFEVTVKKPIQVSISGTGKFITNCQQCSVTCHYPCGISNDANKRGCVAIDGNGYCTQCPGKCYWNVHYNQKYKWEYKDVTEKRTIADLKENFEKATGQKMTVEGLMRELEAEYGIMQDGVNKLIDKSAKCLNRLKEIALKPNPLTTPEYIDMLIEGEKQEAKPGWKQRIKSLMKIKQKAELVTKVEKGEKHFL
ncbi:uncharacterized protein LOC116720920 isoform X2 [Xiphophorus hellerii]|uniref:uncharacterized protein LOC116720920 isoform X2 n=1 Tax=Xiphophorus hellerii TaxID=8084 RepID=UPI0013B36153|nr:uncharacterized protein LOC116720920 isoform X2 [Xiphophorus hellerii]